MKIETIAQLQQSFEAVANRMDGQEWWYARDLQPLFEYDDWRNFEKVIEKARIACTNSEHKAHHHFVDINRMIEIGNGGQREVIDVAMTRYACFLTAQNGDPSKQPVAFAQTYFALQTRAQELLVKALDDAERVRARAELTKSETELSENIVGRTGDGASAGRVRSQGDRALFNRTTQEMKQLLGVPPKTPLADYLQTVVIKAKDFANEVTNATIKVHDLKTEHQMTNAHVASNKEIRGVLERRGIAPETLPPAEDVKKVERRLQSEAKKLPKSVTQLRVPPIDPTKS